MLSHALLYDNECNAFLRFQRKFLFRKEVYFVLKTVYQFVFLILHEIGNLEKKIFYQNEQSLKNDSLG